jgi:serine/threonine-protein kinase
MESAALEIGTVLNERYLIQRIIGQGGMGTVYLAQHLRLDAVMAVKELRTSYNSEQEKEAALQQFESEARFLVSLNHPNLPKVTDAFIESDRCYMVMEFIHGVTLESRLKEADGRPLDVEAVVEWGLQIADVLAYLHSQTPPVIFRDMKPANVMVQPDGNVRLIDFGIARRFQPGAAKDTALFGSVGYSPPEQFGLRQTDSRADIYAFGATLHHLLTGRDPALQPFKFQPAHVLNPGVPESLSRLIETCLAIDAEKRPAGIHEVALNLLAVRDELALRPPVPPSVLAPPGAAADADRPESGVASGGAGSGPRIISAKLAEAEAQKRRESARQRPSGAMAGRKEVMSRLLIAAVCIILLLGGTALALVFHKRPHPHVKPPSTPLNLPKNNDVTASPTPGSSPDNPQPGLADPDTAASDTNDSPATFNQPFTQELVPDGQGGQVLRLHITGNIHGQPNQAGTLAVFFYDGDGNRIPARDPNSVYAHKDGQLVGSHSLETHSEDDSPFDMLVTVPQNEFPSVLPSVIKFRCRVFLNHQSVGATDLIDLSQVPVSPASSGETETGTTTPNGGAAGAGNTPATGSTSGSAGTQETGGIAAEMGGSR